METVYILKHADKSIHLWCEFMQHVRHLHIYNIYINKYLYINIYTHVYIYTYVHLYIYLYIIYK